MSQTNCPSVTKLKIQIKPQVAPLVGSINARPGKETWLLVPETERANRLVWAESVMECFVTLGQLVCDIYFVV